MFLSVRLKPDVFLSISGSVIYVIDSMSLTSIRCFHCEHVCSISIIDFEQVNISWEISVLYVRVSRFKCSCDLCNA